MSSSLIRVGISLGDPLGIGPEVVEKALAALKDLANVDFTLFKSEARPPYTPESAGQYAVNCLNQALNAYEAGLIDALVTAPISKAHVTLAGFDFPGHTEFLAHRTRTEDFLMLMASPRLKVSLVTIHESLSRVPALLTREKIIRTIRLTHQGLVQDFGIRDPHIGVLGLNPHAGEGGKFGREEIELIAPAIDHCRKEWDIKCVGPLVPDATFYDAEHGKYDAVVCMYHDQGLIPFKMLHFKDGVNVTLGLPLVRTSPDHGTAFDIAGQNKADPASMEAAIHMAIAIVKQRLWREKREAIAT